MEHFDDVKKLLVTPTGVNQLLKNEQEISRIGYINRLVNEITQMQASIENMALGNNSRKAVELRNSMIVDVPIVQSLIDHKKVELILLGTNYEQEIKRRSQSPWC